MIFTTHWKKSPEEDSIKYIEELEPEKLFSVVTPNAVLCYQSENSFSFVANNWIGFEARSDWLYISIGNNLEL